MEADWGVFVVIVAEHILILALHVDDCMITGSSSSLVKAFKDENGAHFWITDLGLISWLFGMKVIRDHKKCIISLSQEPYVNTILAKYNFTDIKPVAILINPHAQLLDKQSPKTTNEIAHMQNIPYHQAVRLLIYLTAGTWPDIAFATSFVGQFNNNPGWEHWKAVKWIYKYLSGTKTLALMFGMQTKGLIRYVNVDGATQEHRHTITDFAFLIDGGAILWGSKKQELVMLSMAESEYVATTHAAKEAIWLWRLIREML